MAYQTLCGWLCFCASSIAYVSLVHQVVELLRTFLSRVGDEEGRSSVDALGTQLDSLSTREQVDELQTLLEDFVGLSIEKHNMEHPS